MAVAARKIQPKAVEGKAKEGRAKSKFSALTVYRGLSDAWLSAAVSANKPGMQGVHPIDINEGVRRCFILLDAWAKAKAVEADSDQMIELKDVDIEAVIHAASEQHPQMTISSLLPSARYQRLLVQAFDEVKGDYAVSVRYNPDIIGSKTTGGYEAHFKILQDGAFIS